MLKKSIAISTLLTSMLAMSIRAQQGPAVPPPSASATNGPTMEQTVAFINDALKEQGVMHVTSNATAMDLDQKVLQSEACTLDTYTKGTQTTEGRVRTENSHTAFDLKRSDPLSVRVDNGWFSKQVYTVTVDRAVSHSVPPGNPTPASGPPKPHVSGLVQAVTPTSLTIVSNDDNTLISYVLTKKTTVRTAGQSVGDFGHDIAPTQMKPVDIVDVDAGKTKNGQTEADNVHHIPYSDSSAPQEMNVLSFTDPDTANRVSKALIHAMVLCHPSKANSLF